MKKFVLFLMLGFGLSFHLLFAQSSSDSYYVRVLGANDLSGSTIMKMEKQLGANMIDVFQSPAKRLTILTVGKYKTLDEAESKVAAIKSLNLSSIKYIYIIPDLYNFQPKEYYRIQLSAYQNKENLPESAKLNEVLSLLKLTSMKDVPPPNIRHDGYTRIMTQTKFLNREMAQNLVNVLKYLGIKGAFVVKYDSALWRVK